MENLGSLRRWIGIHLAVLGVLLICPPLSRATTPIDLTRAEQLEKQGLWNDALDLYEQLLQKDRVSAEVRERYQNCLRHIHQVRRHRDGSFRQTILNLSVEHAIKVYGEVLATLQAKYVEKEKVAPQRLFQQGLEELSLALMDEAFRREHLPGATATAVKSFRTQLRETWAGKPIRDQREAHQQVLDIALAARRALGLKPTVAIIEFACGACNCLDEYTVYLTPGQLLEDLASVESELVGVGIEVQIREQKLVISEVAPGSVAERAGLKADDLIVRLGMSLAGQLTADSAREILRGEAGSTIELQIVSPGEEARSVKLVRQPIILPTLLNAHLIDPVLGIGYVHLIGFGRNTMQELDEALLDLRTKGMKGLVLDLRGNPGGLFKTAVRVAERFLPGGIIVSTQSQLRTYNKVHESHSGMNAFDLPLVVLIDGDTASAAEVLAGALKDNQRCLLVGQTTFGKGSIQCVLPLNSVPSGIRLTLAKFFSPRGQPYSGIGVTPHIPVERSSMGFMNDRQLDIALQEAARLVAMR